MPVDGADEAWASETVRAEGSQSGASGASRDEPAAASLPPPEAGSEASELTSLLLAASLWQGAPVCTALRRSQPLPGRSATKARNAATTASRER